MASGCVLSVVAPPILTRLQTFAGLLALVPVGQIVDDVPPRPSYPYVLLEIASERPFNTLGEPGDLKWGGEARVLVRVVSKFRGDQEVAAILHQVRAGLDGYRFTPAGYQPVIATFENAQLLKDTIAGEVVRELVSEFSVEAHQ